MIEKLRNNRGSVGGLVLAVLAAVGIWYGYRSYKAGSLSNDLSAMLADCQRITGRAAMTATDRAVLDQAYNTITQIAAKYKVAAPAPATTP
jgi:hypothetical protein